jgi:hypothetical protein
MQPLKEWRNDVGGHFHHAAARHAVDTIWETTEGAVELYRTSKNSFDIRMPFAYELLTVAMTRNKGQRTEREFLVESLTFLFNAFTAAREAVTVLAMNWLLKKFR